jgi:hypothetical protein
MAYSELWGPAKSLFVAQGANYIPDKVGDTTYGEVADGTTAVCSRPENGQILVYEAMILFIHKLAGMKESEIENLAAFFRKEAISTPRLPTGGPKCRGRLACASL